MSDPVKYLLVYADGRVEESKSAIQGARYIKVEVTPEGHWKREFEVEWACRDSRDDSAPCTIVALERSCVLTRSMEQVMRDDEELREKLMRRVLRAIFEDKDA